MLLYSLGVTLAPLGPVTAADDPLAPLDTSSPQATYLSFLEQSDAIDQAAVEYAANRSFEKQRDLAREFGKLERLFDISAVPETTRDETAVQSWAYLADILMRIELPDPSTIPDGEMLSDGAVPHWTLPGTEVKITRVDSGEHEGEYVFSADTVAGLPEWRELVQGQPLLGPEQGAVTDWRAWETTTSGPLIPLGLIEALPDTLRDPLLGSPLWKVIVGILGAMLVTLVVAAWYRWIGSRGPKGTVRGHVLSLTTPIVLVILLEAYRLFMETQINSGGTFAEFVLFGTTIVYFLALAWAFRALTRLVVEWVIATPVITEGTYDAQLVRLLSRVISIVGALGIVLYGANDIGIPALGLLAGLGIGGLVIGLAAQGTVENLIGGLTLYTDQPFRLGDFVALGDDLGTVDMIGPRSTRIRKLDGTRLSMPNSEVTKSRVTNFTQRANVLFLHTVGVRYETTREQLELLASRIAEGMREHPLVIADENMPRVRVAGFGASSIDIEVRAYIDTTDFNRYMAVQEQLLLMVHRIVEDVGTSIAFPSTTAYLTRDHRIAAGPSVAESPATEVSTLADQRHGSLAPEAGPS